MINNEFSTKLFIKLLYSLTNNYKDNYDDLRFGKLPVKRKSLRSYIKFLILKENYITKNSIRNFTDRTINLLEKHNDGLNWLYNNFSDEISKSLLIDLILYRILGHQFIKLPVNHNRYWEKINTIDKLADKTDKISMDFKNWDLYLYDLQSIGYDIRLYYITQGINANFVLEQYAYRSQYISIEARPGDYVIDAGGCWGDTSLYFASKVGENGKVYSFEFIPGNIKIFEKNISLNPALTKLIHLIKKPLYNIDNQKVYFTDNGPASIVSFEPLDHYNGETETISIDKFIDDHEINKVDFIKMDIEGAEYSSLTGALKTIKRFKPVLAIAIYHSLEDFTRIPRWINDLNLGYKLFLGHYTIHAEETILFATIEK